jgi:indolepyruvate ferredoxin oxidoreductase beta subunit
MARPGKVTSIVVAGLGGQGVLKATDIIAGVAFARGLDVKKSEVHGMSQRGGSVASDVRFGEEVFSPMAPPGEADFLVLLDPDQREANRGVLGADGVALDPGLLDPAAAGDQRSRNVAMVGLLSAWLDFGEAEWEAAIRAHLPERHHESNLRAFHAGRAAGGRIRAAERIP